MKLIFCVIGIVSSTCCGHGQNNKVTGETNAVLESSIVLDKAAAVQGNTLLKIERLSTPDEEAIKALEAKKSSANQVTLVDPAAAFLKRQSYFVSAIVYDHTYTLLAFRSLSGGSAPEVKVWSNITSWSELAASPKFVHGDVEYTLMIMPSAAEVTDESPALPTNLPSLISGGAYYQEVGEQVLKASEVSFMESLHVHYALKKDEIVKAYLKKVEEAEEKASAKEREAREQKTVTLRFWRQEDKPTESTQSK